jgi:hypothetical protein
MPGTKTVIDDPRLAATILAVRATVLVSVCHARDPRGWWASAETRRTLTSKRLGTRRQ